MCVRHACQVISCRALIVVLSLNLFDFYILENVRNPSRGPIKCLVYTTAELRTRVVAI